MVRKQLYITEAQEAALKHLAREAGLSEAELTRRALGQFLSPSAAQPLRPGRDGAIEALMQTTRSLGATHRFPHDFDFDRADLYSTRGRFGEATRE